MDYRREAAHAVRELLGGEYDVEGYFGPTAVQDYVDDRCGDLVPWSVRSAGDGWCASLTVNGKDVLALSDAATWPWDRHDDSSSARRWLEGEVERLWPGLVKRATLDPRSEDFGVSRAEIAYAPRV